MSCCGCSRRPRDAIAGGARPGPPARCDSAAGSCARRITIWIDTRRRRTVGDAAAALRQTRKRERLTLGGHRIGNVSGGRAVAGGRDGARRDRRRQRQQTRNAFGMGDICPAAPDPNRAGRRSLGPECDDAARGSDRTASTISSSAHPRARRRRRSSHARFANRSRSVMVNCPSRPNAGLHPMCGAGTSCRRPARARGRPPRRSRRT
jgi:hypothetical protein